MSGRDQSVSRTKFIDWLRGGDDDASRALYQKDHRWVREYVSNRIRSSSLACFADGNGAMSCVHSLLREPSLTKNDSPARRSRRVRCWQRPVDVPRRTRETRRITGEAGWQSCQEFGHQPTRAARHHAVADHHPDDRPTMLLIARSVATRRPSGYRHGVAPSAMRLALFIVSGVVVLSTLATITCTKVHAARRG